MDDKLIVLEDKVVGLLNEAYSTLSDEDFEDLIAITIEYADMLARSRPRPTN